MDKVSELGSELGKALAIIHSAGTRKHVEANSKIVEKLSHTMEADVLSWAARNPMVNRFCWLPNERIIYNRVKQHDEDRPARRHCSLIFGNLSPSTILMDASESDTNWNPAFTGWSFARINDLGVAKDAAVFLAYFHSELIMAANDEALRKCFLTFHFDILCRL